MHFLLSTKCLFFYFFIIKFTESYGYLPEMSPDESEIYLNENDTLEITCTSSRRMVFYYPSNSTEFRILSQEDIQEDELNGIHTINFRRYKALHGDTGWYGCGHDDEENKEKIRWIYVYVKSDERFFVESDSFESFKKEVNQSVTLPCRPTSPEYKVLLTADDRPIEESENVIFNATLGFTLKNLKVKDSAYYTCSITVNGIREDNNFNVLIIRASSVREPLIIKDPLRHVARGQTLRVNCTVDVDKDTNYKLSWTYPQPNPRISTKTWRQSHGESSNVLTVTTEMEIIDVADKDAGTYNCTIATWLTTKSTSVNLIVRDPGIKFIILSTNKNYYQRQDGDDIQWVVTIEAYPQPEITWFDPMGNEIRGEWSVLDVNKYAVQVTATSTTLRIVNLEVKDMGVYVVQAKSPDSSIIEFQNFTLEVLAKPLIQDLENVQLYYMPNEIAKIHCLAAAFPRPQVTWTFNDDSISEKLTNTIEDVKLTSVNSTVMFPIESTGSLTCTAENILGNYSVMRTIFVTDVPEGFGVIGPKEKVTIGDSLELICGVSVYNWTNEIEWLDSNNQPIKNSARINVTKISTDFTHRAILTINPVIKSDEQIYICLSQLKNGGPMTKDYTLEVYDEKIPYFIDTNMNKTESIYTIGKKSLKSINLRCYVDGMPKPVITWWKDNVQMNTSDQTPTGLCETIFINNNQELNIEYLYEKCSGKYLCRAENRLGFIETYQHIIVEGPKLSLFLIVAGTVSLIILIILLLLVCIKMRRERTMRKELMEAGLTHFEEGALECLNPELTVDDQAELLPYDKKWEFPRDKLKFGKQLGSGAFGVVMKAEAQGIYDSETSTTVAVKMVRRSTESTYIRALASELKIMVHLGKHLNVVNLLGACTKNIAKRELLVIVEYCRFGNLHQYLMRHRSEFINQIDPGTGKIDVSIGSDVLARSASVGSNNSLSSGSSTGSPNPDNSTGRISMSPDGMVLSNNSTQPGWRSNYRGDYKDLNLKPICTQDLLSWAFQVARGMEYLSQRKVLHGDLAARNILLAEDNVVKICDFGLAKTMYKDDNYKKQGDAPLPIKWMAIESIRDRIFSTQSDVWSFGIVLWEFFTLAETPYPGMEAGKQYLKLIEGYRMEKPEFATNEVYDIMLDCWKSKPGMRPTFTDLVDDIGDLLDESVKTHYVDLNIPYRDMNTMLNEDGNNDYLKMMSAPDHEILSSSTRDYVNGPCITSLSDADIDTSYICMSPTSKNNDSGIFSPRDTSDKIHFDFPSPELRSNVHSDSESEAVEMSPMLKSEDDNYLKPINIQERRAEFARQRQAMKAAGNDKVIKERDSGYCNTPQNLKMLDIRDEVDSRFSDKDCKTDGDLKNNKFNKTGVIRDNDNYVNMPRQKNYKKEGMPDSFTNPSYLIMGNKNIPHTNV